MYRNSIKLPLSALPLPEETREHLHRHRNLFAIRNVLNNWRLERAHPLEPAYPYPSYTARSLAFGLITRRSANKWTQWAGGYAICTSPRARVESCRGDVIGPFIGSLWCQCRCIANSLQGFP